MRKDDALKFFPKINLAFPSQKKRTVWQRAITGARALHGQRREGVGTQSAGGDGNRSTWGGRGALSINHGGDKALQ